jgi:hypothetical protein
VNPGPNIIIVDAAVQLVIAAAYSAIIYTTLGHDLLKALLLSESDEDPEPL